MTDQITTGVLKRFNAIWICASVAALFVLSNCAPQIETSIYARILPGDVFEGVLLFSSGEATFTVIASADGEQSREIFSASNDGEPGNRKPVKVELESYAGQFVVLKITARGDGASWENARISHSAKSPPGANVACPGGKCNVIVYMVDTLRKDRLGCYGYDKPASPRLDEFARQSMVYTRAYAPSSWTRSSVASLFTGLNPPSHGAVSRDEMLRDNIPTLAESFKKNGYTTVGFISNGNVSPELGFGRGFDSYVYMVEDLKKSNVYASSGEMLEKVLPELEKIPEPFFAYIHVVDPHAPYTPSAEIAGKFIPAGSIKTSGAMDVFKSFIWRNPPANPAQVKYLSGLYDGEVAEADSGFGVVIDWLGKKSLTDKTVVVFTSDHGEEFFDHMGLGHGGTLYEELVAIPLVIRYPGAQPGTNAGHAGLIDVMPTLLGFMGITAPGKMDGRDLRAYPGSGENKYRTIYLHQKLDKVEKEAVVSWPYKLIHNINRTNQWGEGVLEYEFYNLQNSPNDRGSIKRGFPITRKVLIEIMSQMRGNGRSGPSATITDELKRRLESLGY